MSKSIDSLGANLASHANQGASKANNRNSGATEKTAAAEKKEKKEQPSAIVSLNKSASQAPELYSPTSVSKKAVQPVQSAPPPKATTPTVPGKNDTAKTQAPKVEAKEEPKKASTTDGIDAGNGPVVVDILQSESGYNNKIYYSTDNFATKHLLGTDNNVASVNLGTFAAGTKIQFAIDNGQGNFFKAGAASQNADGIQHANVTNNSDGVTIGFEDLWGGGDRDFNDAIIQVHTSSAPVQPPVVTPPAPQPPTQTQTPPVVQKPETKDNRSGLGDGTNPGKGAGTDNSPNTGTLNPGNNNGTTKPVATDKPSKVEQTAKAEKPAKVQDTDKSDNRSGLGDGTNPGKGAGTVNSPNTGTLNPGNDIAGTSSSTSAKKTKTAENSDNRSGLGDGTNPGQGAGRTNATNQGTLNPNQAAKKTSQVV